MKSTPLFIFDGVRTPFCRSGSALAGFDAVELGRIEHAADAGRQAEPRKADNPVPPAG